MKNPDRFNRMVNELEGQSNEIIKDCTTISYFMRGALDYDRCYEITPRERRIMTDFLKIRLKEEAKKPPSQNF